MKKRIVIVGGGLAGLITSIHLTRAGVPCTLVEKKIYPFHRVCGEYISNEVIPYLRSLDCLPDEFQPAQINELQLTSVNGKEVCLPLDLGGFGISRYKLDHFLFQRAEKLGVKVLQDTEVLKIEKEGDTFRVYSNKGNEEADLVIGSFGKRSRLDVQMNRPFITKRSPFVGVKYHVLHEPHPHHRISLHNFKNGYCGISRIEGGKLNLCYLTHRDNLKTHGTISSMEKEVLCKNPFIKEIFDKAEFIFDKPETINEISFETKAPVENHIFMVGDAAGMITPLCGNGMAMAIHSAKTLSELVVNQFIHGESSVAILEKLYSKSWKELFARRLWAGRQLQRLFGDPWSSNLAVNLAKTIRPAANFLIKNTHGAPF